MVRWPDGGEGDCWVVGGSQWPNRIELVLSKADSKPNRRLRQIKSSLVSGSVSGWRFEMPIV